MKSYNFLGIPVEGLTYADMLESVDRWLSDKKARSHHIAVINTYCIMSAFYDKRLSGIYNGADIITPDGMPFVYWIRAALRIPCDQFDASSVVVEFARRSKESGYTFYLYGGHPDVVVEMRRKLETMFPGIRIAGYRSPPFRSLSAEEDGEICDEINQLKPDIICVGLGTPKQDYWIDDHLEKIRGSVMVPCGAIFDFFGGRVKRAPRFVQKSGFEWLYRLLGKDFKRLLKRYTVLNALFLWNFALQVFNVRVRKPCRWRRP